MMGHEITRGMKTTFADEAASMAEALGRRLTAVELVELARLYAVAERTEPLSSVIDRRDIDDDEDLDTAIDG